LFNIPKREDEGEDDGVYRTRNGAVAADHVVALAGRDGTAHPDVRLASCYQHL